MQAAGNIGRVVALHLTPCGPRRLPNLMSLNTVGFALWRIPFLTVIMVVCILRASAQTGTPKYEIGAQFSTVTFDDNEPVVRGNIAAEFKDVTKPSVGIRFTYNLNDYISFDVETNFFIGSTQTFAPVGSGGNVIETISGIKAGKRFRRFGVFAKTRPGVVSFGEGKFPEVSESGTLLFKRASHLALDLGGVVEYYPTRHYALRFDAGDTIIRYGVQTIPNSGNPPVLIPGETRHNLQLSAGIGFRF